jgi:hypothetical protein
MKNKKNIYILVPAVLIIWGIIGYKILSAINPDEEEIVTNNTISQFVPKEIKEVEKFTIQANYRDPFLGKLYTKNITKKPKNNLKKDTKPPVVFPHVTYNGMIAPKEPNRPTLFLITINGKQQFMSFGKQIEDVKLLKGNDKEIIVSFKSLKKTIAIK